MASSALKIAAKTIKKMHVPAYCPVVVGVHDMDHNGVVVDVKKTMAISFAPINMLLFIDIEASLEVGMDIPDMVEDAMPDIVMLPIFILTRLGLKCLLGDGY